GRGARPHRHPDRDHGSAGRAPPRARRARPSVNLASRDAPGERLTPLSERTVLLTGASKGIGAATARALGDAGAFLVAHYRSAEAGVLEATAAIPAERKVLVRADLADP